MLHLLAAAQAKLLAPGAAQVPLAARVWCQPIQMRVGGVLGWDCAQANRWRWRPDYEGVELGRCRWALAGCWPSSPLHTLSQCATLRLPRCKQDAPSRSSLHMPAWPCSCRESWVPLGEPVEAFYFDLTDAVAHMAPAEAALPLRFAAAGVFNAVATWFDLQLDEEASLRCGGRGLCA